MDDRCYTPVMKEDISKLSFHRDFEIDQKIDLRDKLEKAAILGNIYHSKVVIYFDDDEGPKKVETTIWAVGSKFVCLKGGLWIPISRISEVEYNR